jgi:hypothetical protein
MVPHFSLLCLLAPFQPALPSEAPWTPAEYAEQPQFDLANQGERIPLAR